MSSNNEKSRSSHVRTKIGVVTLAAFVGFGACHSCRDKEEIEEPTFTGVEWTEESETETETPNSDSFQVTVSGNDYTVVVPQEEEETLASKEKEEEKESSDEEKENTKKELKGSSTSSRGKKEKKESSKEPVVEETIPQETEIEETIPSIPSIENLKGLPNLVEKPQVQEETPVETSPSQDSGSSQENGNGNSNDSHRPSPEESNPHRHQFESTVSYVSNQDGTHQKRTDYKCSCGVTLPFTLIQEDCTFGLVSDFDDYFETVSCENCGYEKKQPHEFQREIQGNGMIITTCKHEGCGYRKVQYPVHECTPKDFLYSDDTMEFWSCTICDQIVEKAHSYTNGNSVIDKDTYEVIQDCDTPECKVKKRTPHVHTDYIVKSFDETEEQVECKDCTYPTTRSHSLGRETIDKNRHLVVQECEHDGCDYEATKEHDHISTTFVSNTDENETWKCDDCEKEITKNHVLGEEEIDKVQHNVVQKCTTPECSYEERKEHNHTSYSFQESLGKDGELWTCDDCEKETTKGHVLGAEEVDKTQHNVVQKCTTPGCNYEERKEHDHTTYSFQENLGDEGELWTCDECEKESTREHQLKSGVIDKGTHEVVEECQTSGCDYEKRTPHVHTAIHFESNQGANELWKCDDCDAEITKEHQFGSETIDPLTFDKVQTCETPGCNEEKRIRHSTEANPHIYSFAGSDEAKETYTCEVCGDSYTQEHSWDTGTYHDGYFHQECQNPDCGQTREYHNHIKGDPRISFFNDGSENCYKVVYYCSVCGEYVDEDMPVGHDLEDDGDIYICLNPGCNYTKEKESSSSFEDGPEIFDEVSQSQTLLSEIIPSIEDKNQENDMILPEESTPVESEQEVIPSETEVQNEVTEVQEQEEESLPEESQETVPSEEESQVTISMDEIINEVLAEEIIYYYKEEESSELEGEKVLELTL